MIPAAGYSIRIGDLDYPVVMAQGGSLGIKQNYVVRIPVTDRPEGLSARLYVSPLIYHETTRRYTTFNPEFWYDSNRTPRFRGAVTSAEASKAQSLDKSCSGCHFTSVSLRKEGEEWAAVAPPSLYYREGDPHYEDLDGDGVREAQNIGCERCHGPGLRHVQAYWAPGRIINPRHLTPEQNNELCASCHSRGASRPNGIFSFPYDEVTETPYALQIGAELRKLFWTDNPGLWPDRAESSRNRQQGYDMRSSAHWRAGVTCATCHDMHRADLKQIRRTITAPDAAGNPMVIRVRVEDNTLCLACHAGEGSFQGLRREDLLDLSANWVRIAGVVGAHTRHPYAPEEPGALGRCTECHMAKVAVSANAYDTRSHTFAVIRPQQTLDTQDRGGMPNSCAASCHGGLAARFGLPPKPSANTWNTPADVEHAMWLRRYYGPEGLWWRHQQGEWSMVLPSPEQPTALRRFQEHFR